MAALRYHDGETWSDVRYDDALVEPICQASLMRYLLADSGDRRVLFSNPASGEKRVRMTARLSVDEAKTWTRALVLHEGPAAYSCLVVLKDGWIGCLFEAGEKSPYEKVVLTRFPLSELKGKVRSDESRTWIGDSPVRSHPSVQPGR